MKLHRCTCRARWRGTELSILLGCSRGSCADQYQVLVDGKEAALLALEKGQEVYKLASGLPEGEHHVEVPSTALGLQALSPKVLKP